MSQKDNSKVPDLTRILNLSVDTNIAIYLTCRDRMQTEATCELASLWMQKIQTKIRFKFYSYRETKSLEAFKQLWGRELVSRNPARLTKIQK